MLQVFVQACKTRANLTGDGKNYIINGDRGMNYKILKRCSFIGLAGLNSILIAIYVVTVVWGGYAYTASGIPVPDTGLTIPVLLFFVLSAGQMVAVALNKPVVAIILCVVKIILFAISLYLLCGYAVNDVYMNYGMDSGFYSNFTYGILVIASAVTGAISFIFEFVTGLFLLRGLRK